MLSASVYTSLTHAGSHSQMDIEGFDVDRLELETISYSKAQVHEMLEEEFGYHFHKAPDNGIYHLFSDTEFDIPKKAENVIQFADAYCELPSPVYGDNEYDCEDYALTIYTLLTAAHPALSVGVMFSNNTDHAYNLFITEDEGIVYYEPMGCSIPDSSADLYQTEKGVLLF